MRGWSRRAADTWSPGRASKPRSANSYIRFTIPASERKNGGVRCAKFG
jgi:hypothetical protein